MSNKREAKGLALGGDGDQFPIASPPFDVGAPRMWVTSEDELVFNYRTHETTIDVTHTLRVLRLDGTVDHIEERVTLTATSNVASHVMQLGDGWLVGVKLNDNGTRIRGRIWAYFELRYGLTGGTYSGVQLAAGYLTNISRVSWPYSGLPSSLDGRGEFHELSVADATSGSDFSQAVPTMERWRVLGVTFRSQGDATAATRYPGLRFTDGTNTIMRAYPTVGHTASNSLWCMFAHGAGAGGVVDVAATIPFPDVVLREGDAIESTVLNGQAGDTIDNIYILVERWFEEQS